LRRAFTYGSFRSGGRLAGGFWLNLERDLRLSRLRIGGERVASVDFDNFNPRLLYARAGATPTMADLYCFPGLEKYRRGMKRLVNARLFDLGERKSKPKRTAKEIREGVRLYPEGMSIGDLLKIVETAHRPIVHYFGTSIGHELQFVESKLLLRILLELQGLGVVALPVHDCVMVARSAVPKAMEVMASVTMEEVGISMPVTVEEESEERGSCDDISLPINPPGHAQGL
jgi:hypothetical protein